MIGKKLRAYEITEEIGGVALRSADEYGLANLHDGRAKP